MPHSSSSAPSAAPRRNRALATVAGLAGLAALAAPGAALAGHCGYASPNWDVPHGDLIVNKSNGLIGSVLVASGQYATHTALSTSGWVTHATFDEEAIHTNNSCSTPVTTDSIRVGQPGAQQISIGGFWLHLAGALEYWSQSGNNPNDDWGFNADTGAWTFFPGGSNRGTKVADFLWDGVKDGKTVLTYPWVGTSNGTGYFRIADPNGNLNYSFYQYMNIESRGRNAGTSQNNGVVCSTLQAYASNQSGAGWVTTQTIGQPALKNGIQALYNAVRYACKQQIGGFKNFVCNLNPFGEDPCDNAADQVVNCFVSNRCGSSDSNWTGVRDSSGSKAVTVGPDCLDGKSCFQTGGGASPWAWNLGGHSPTFSGSPTFSCWD